MPTTASTYLLDPAWHAERERLNSLSALYDPTTLELCVDLGLTAGWRCVDAGAGTGSVAERCSRSAVGTGPGRCSRRHRHPLPRDPLANDILPGVAATRPRPSTPLATRSSSTSSTPGCCSSTCPTAMRCWRRWCARSRPGGWLRRRGSRLGDRRTSSTRRHRCTRVVADACMTLFAGDGYDPYFGRRLPRAFEHHGLDRGRTPGPSPSRFVRTLRVACRSGNCSSTNSPRTARSGPRRPGRPRRLPCAVARRRHRVASRRS